MQWKHFASPAKKAMLTVFWDHEGILLTAFQRQEQTVNAASYCNILRKLRKIIPTEATRTRWTRAVTAWFRQQPKEFYAADVQGLMRRRDKFLNVEGDYVEK
jgi:hypothetical protein